MGFAESCHFPTAVSVDTHTHTHPSESHEQSLKCEDPKTTPSNADCTVSYTPKLTLAELSYVSNDETARATLTARSRRVEPDNCSGGAGLDNVKATFVGNC